MRRDFFRIGRVLVAVALLGSGASAHADDTAAMKKSGDEAFDAGHFDEAMRNYERAYSLSQDPSLLYDLGRSHEAMGRYPLALAHLTLFSTLASADARKKTPKLEVLIEDLERRVATVRVRSNVGDARLVVRDVVVGATVLGTTTIKVNAGDARVEVLKDGYVPWAQVVELRGGTTKAIDVHLLIKPAPIEAPKPETSTKPSQQSPQTSASIVRTWWFWGSVAAALVGGALVFAWLVSEDDQPATGSAGNIRTPLITF